MIEFRQIELFVCVAEELHFGRAAVRLGMAQPPLSQQILKLERTLDTKLFTRTSRKVTLTAAGQQLLSDGRQLLARRQEACLNINRAAAGVTGTLRVGFAASSALGLLPKLVSRFRADYPDVQLHLSEGSVQGHAQALLNGDLDLALVRGPFDHLGLSSETILKEPVVAVLQSQSVFLNKSPTVALAELADQPFLLFPRTAAPDFYDMLLRMCREAGFAPKIVQAAESWPSIAALVSAGMGVALAPQSAGLLLPPGTAVCPISDVSGSSELVIAVRTGVSTPAADHFKRAAFEAVCGELPA